MPTTKCIIFDCDGTLVDSELITNQHCVNFYHDHGYTVQPEEALKQFTGMTMEGVHDHIFNTTGIKIPAEKWFSNDYRQKLYQDFQVHLRPLMTSVLEKLNKYRIDRCVASNSMPDRICKALDYSNQRHFFEDQHIFSAQQVSWPKPAPDLFLFACMQMGYLPEECVVIEDTTVGIHAALAAGIPVIAFLGGAHAGHDWYIEKIKACNVPIAYNSQDLWDLLKDKMNIKDDHEL